MATYNLTDKNDNVFTKANITSRPVVETAVDACKKVEAFLDIEALIAGGYTVADGDVFQLLPIAANTTVLMAGAEVMTAFDGTSPTVDIDFAGGDDMVDGGDVSATGFLAAGTNGTSGTTIIASASKNYTDYVSTEDTIDVVLNAASADVTQGVLRVYAVLVDLGDRAAGTAKIATRDYLA